MLLNKEADKTNTLKYNSPYKQYKCPPLVHNIHFKPNISMCECERVLISFLIRYHLEPYFHKNCELMKYRWICKILILNERLSLRINCTYRTYGQTDRRTRWPLKNVAYNCLQFAEKNETKKYCNKHIVVHEWKQITQNLLQKLWLVDTSQMVYK